MYKLADYKKRVNFQVGKSIKLNDNEVGSYMMIYMIGKNVGPLVEHAVNVFSNGKFDKLCVDVLRQLDVHFVIKAGTTKNRKSVRPVDPYNIRGKEILNELGKCFQGVTDGADKATRVAHKILSSNNLYECQAVMVALNTHDITEYTTDIEFEINNYVKDTYGIEVANVATTFAPRATTRWGANQISVTF